MKTIDSSLRDIEIDVPELRLRDVLVRVLAVSANPADVKQRAAAAESRESLILGYDGAGIVEAVGPQVNTLAVGDEVWYAGDITRHGSNAEFQAVDETTVAPKPVSLSFADAVALPLTTITGWSRCSTDSA
jgi:NADPH:quinone reductase-like Zn-dependent oxidoreductase